MPDGRAVDVAIAVVEWNGGYLAGLRDAGAVLAGFDEFPGGKVRPGEEPTRAAERECLEETGIAVAAVRLVMPVLEHHYDHGKVRLHFYLCEPLSAIPPDPLPPFRWVKPGDLANLRFPEANRAVLDALLSGKL